MSNGITCGSIRRNINANEGYAAEATIALERDERDDEAALARKFQICEQFSDEPESYGLQLHGNGISVVMRLSA